MGDAIVLDHGRGAAILRSHGFASAPCERAGFILGCMISTHRDFPGQVFESWEEVALTVSTLRIWLGY